MCAIKMCRFFSWFTDNCSDHLDTVFHNLSTKITTITKEKKTNNQNKLPEKKEKKGRVKSNQMRNFRKRKT